MTDCSASRKNVVDELEESKHAAEMQAAEPAANQQLGLSETPLSPHIALLIKKGNVNDVLAAITDANINHRERESGDTALHLSVAFHRTKLSGKLLKIKAQNVNAINFKGETPLLQAIIYRNLKAFKQLFSRSELRTDLSDICQNNVLHHAAAKQLTSRNIRAVIKKLRKNSFDQLVKQKNSRGNSVLHEAAYFGALEVAEAILPFSSDLLRERNNCSETPLCISFRASSDKLVAFFLSSSSADLIPADFLVRVVDGNLFVLLERLLDICFPHPRKTTAVVLGYKLHADVLKEIDHRIEHFNDSGRDKTHLQECVVKSRIEMLKVLLAWPGIDAHLTIPDQEGNSFLHLAVEPKWYNTTIVAMLLGCLAKIKKSIGKSRASWQVYDAAVVNKKNRKQETPLLQLFIHAAELGDRNVVQFGNQLILLGAEVTAYDSKGCSSLYYATTRRNMDAITMLRRHGARADVANNDGLSPLDIATAMEDAELLNVLTADASTLY